MAVVLEWLGQTAIPRLGEFFAGVGLYVRELIERIRGHRSIERYPTRVEQERGEPR
jgi:hypothetical protein